MEAMVKNQKNVVQTKIFFCILGEQYYIRLLYLII